MSVNVGTAYVEVVPSARGFAGKLQSQLGSGSAAAGARAGESASKSFGARFKDGVGKAAKVAFAGFLGAGAAIGGLATLGIKTAAANEQAQISFTTMLGSAKKAGAFLKDLQKFAAATPFEFPELQTAASSLISAGINANKVIPIMRTLGDVTSGMGTGSEGVQRATIALQQMNAAGRITGEDLNQLRDAGIPVYDLLSKATGKSKAEVVKLAQAGKLGSKELGQMMNALETGKGLERFSGLMDKQSASLSGMWSTFKDTLGQGLANAVQPLIPMMKDGLGKAAAGLATVLPKVARWLARVLSVAGDMKDAFSFGKEWESHSPFESFAVGARVAYDAIVKFIGQFRAGEGAGGKFRDMLGTVRDVIVKVVTAGVRIVKFMNDHRTTTLAAVGAVAALVAITKIHAAVMAVEAAGGILKMIQSTKVVTAVTKTWTAVQWLMNAALTANPIGIVIAALVALGIGLVIAYKKSETFRKIVAGAFDAIAAAARFMWNNVVAPVIRFLLDAFVKVTGFYAALLRGLSKVPGFGWAKGAADKLQNVANKAAGIKDAIHDIPSRKDVSVNFHVNGTGQVTLANGVKVDVGQFRARAAGGPVVAGQPYIVGEHRPELFVPDSNGRIEPRVGGGKTDLSDATLYRLAAILHDTPMQANISAAALDHALAGAL